MLALTSVEIPQTQINEEREVERESLAVEALDTT